MSDYVQDLFGLSDKVVIVTGASRGIGHAIATACSKAGAHTFGLGRTDPDQISGDDIEFEYLQCDVSKQGAFESVCDDVVARAGGLDCLINAAGITVPNTQDHQSVEDLKTTLNVNLVGAYQSCIIAAAHMKRRGAGSIVNVTSIGSLFGFPNNPAYTSSKGGLRLLSKSLAYDLAKDHIRVNNLAPGYIKTDMTRGSYEDPIKHAQRLERMMLPRWGAPEDIAAAAVFLASHASSYITGTDLVVDGGWSAKGI